MAGLYELLWNSVIFLIALSILIAVHEFGHFWVARRCGVKVERFSLGFGKVLLRWRDKQHTEYVISLIPLGGYVKMLDERNETVSLELRHMAFNTQSISRRTAIIAAGPVANFIFALFAYWIIFMAGTLVAKPVIEQIVPGSIAEQAGLQPGMKLKSINGEEVDGWDSVHWAFVELIGKSQVEIEVTEANSDVSMLKSINLRDWHWSPDKESPLTTIGIIPVSAKVEPVLEVVQDKSAAQHAGLLVGDRIVAVNGEPLKAWAQFASKVQASPGKPLQLTIERAEHLLPVTLIPAAKWKWSFKSEGKAGVLPKVIPLAEQYFFTRQYGVIDSFTKATEKTWRMMQLTVDMIAKLVTGDVKLNTLSGPISIAQGAGVSAQYGMLSFMLFLALISINLGVINLFPLPMLDGGHLLFLLIEKIKGVPVSGQFQEYSYRIGAMVLLILMGLALFNDFSRL